MINTPVIRNLKENHKRVGIESKKGDRDNLREFKSQEGKIKKWITCDTYNRSYRLYERWKICPHELLGKTWLKGTQSWYVILNIKYNG